MTKGYACSLLKIIAMKTILFVLAVSLCFSPKTVSGQSYNTGDTLFVVANSGLRLRTSPNTDAGTIRILSYGEPVRVVDTHGFDGAHAGKAGWYDGHWIYVANDRVHGYLFDAYLSSLSPITHEDELCSEPLHFAAPMQAYLINHYPPRADQQGSTYREDIDQCITYHDGNISSTVTSGHGWYKTDVRFGNARMCEVVNLLRSMLIGNEMLQVFDESMTFHTDKFGQLARVRGGVEAHQVTIEMEGSDVVVVSITELIDG
jgi:hypothetical protein